MKHRLTFANVIAMLALFISLGGGVYAASKLPRNSVGSSQLKTNAVTSDEVKDGGLLAADFKAGQVPAGATGPTGPAGPKGDEGQRGPEGPRGLPGEDGQPGDDGEPGQPGASGIVSTATFAGSVGSPTLTEDFAFVGGTATVATTTGQRLTGAAMAPLGLDAGGPSDIGLSLCYRPAAGGTLSSFGPATYPFVEVSTVRTSHAVAQSVSPGAGSWNVGVCARLGFGSPAITLDDSDFVNGWVQVTN